MSEAWPCIPGVIIQGHGVASGQGASPYPRGTLEMQKPFFLARGVDLSPYYEGTLNISIAPRAFAMTRPAITLRRVEWTKLHPPEDFSFSPCRLTAGGVTADGLVYYPHPETKIRHFQDPAMIEVLAPWIDGLSYGGLVELALNPAEITITGG